MRKFLATLLILLLTMPFRSLAAETADTVKTAAERLADTIKTPAEPLSVDIKKDWVDQTRDIVDILTLFGVAVGVLTFYVSRKDAKSSGVLNRFEKYQQMQARYIENLGCILVRASLEAGGKQLAEESKYNKYVFMSFYEEIALMLQSNLLREDVVFHMFSFDSMRAYENELFWRNIDKSDPYWQLFRNFCHRMIRFRDKYPNKQWPVKDFKF